MSSRTIEVTSFNDFINYEDDVTYIITTDISATTLYLCIQDEDNTLNTPVVTKGLFSQRPPVNRLYPGFFFFATDSNLNKPLWYNGQNWTDTEGNVVS